MEQNLSMSNRSQKAATLKKDLLLAAVIGFVCALFILPIIKQAQFNIPYELSLIIILPILSVLGMLLAIVIAQKIKVIYQVAKFVLVGALNTLIDWGVLNLLLFLANIASGPFYSVFKGISFIVAVTNSYFWNKFWTFKKAAPAVLPSGERKSTGKEVLQYFVISIIGFTLNVAIASLIVNVWGPHFNIFGLNWAPDLAAKRWGTFGALVGTLTGLVWNFLGYKLIVFKK
jgi:putative flippase GtrA